MGFELRIHDLEATDLPAVPIQLPSEKTAHALYSANVYVLVLWRKHLYVYLTRYGVRDNV